MDSEELARICCDCGDARKAESPVVMDVRELSTVTDFFVVLTGTSDPHIRAIVEEVRERLRDDWGVRPLSCDGVPPASWIVMDYTDVIVHVMTPEIRERYDLEGLWGDAPRIGLRELPQGHPEGSAAEFSR